MDYHALATKFMEDAKGWSSPQHIMAIRAFAQWLSENASQQSFAPDVAKYCPQCGNKYDGVLCGECGFTTSPRR